jgi:hypothetical protein
MEIQVLKLVVTEADLNNLMRKFVVFPDSVRDLRIAIVPHGIVMNGIYQTLIAIPFQLLWCVSMTNGRIDGHLEKLKAGPISLSLLKRFVVDAIAGATSALEVRGDTLVLDIDELLQEEGWPLRVNLSSITCDEGRVTIESSASALGRHRPESVS